MKTHKVTASETVRIVGFEILPRSIANGSSLSPETIDKQPPQLLSKGAVYEKLDEGILFSYSIKTVQDPKTTWASRMDHYYSIGKF